MFYSEEIGCKWPNDIYWKKKVKLGGIITRSSVMGSVFSVCIGIGINLGNERPFPGVNILTGVTVNREELIANMFNNLALD